jgi:hypothetical protein
MSPPVLDYDADFRRAAVQASVDFLPNCGVAADDVDLTRCGASLCLAAGGDPQWFRRHCRRLMLSVLVFGVGTIVAGFAVATVVSPRLDGRWRFAAVGAGAALVVGGNAVMVSAKRVESGALVQYRRSTRAAKPTFAPAFAPIVVTVEDPGTVQKIKTVTEDVAELFVDASRRVVVIEGFSHRYVIWAADVVAARIRRTASVDFVVVTFRVGHGEQLLEMAIAYGTAGILLQRMLGLLRRPPLADLLQREAGITVQGA